MTLISRLLCGGIAMTSVAGCGHAQIASASITVTIEGQRRGEADTLEKAIALARAARRDHPHAPIVIQLPAGTIYLKAPIALSQADTGTATAPLVFRGQPDGSSVISGAIAVGSSKTGETRIDLATAAPQLQPTPSAAFNEGSNPNMRLFLFEGQRRLALSVWPISGYVTDWSKPASISTLIRTNGDIPSGDQLVVDGFLYADWQHKAFAGRSDGHRLDLAGTSLDLPVQKTPRLRLFNVPGPLGPGRYTLDNSKVRVQGFVPGEAIETAIASSLFTLDRADHIHFEKIAFEKTTGTAVKAVQSSWVSLSDCYIGLTGGYAVEADGGHDLRIDRCVVTHSAAGGFRLNGGDRTTLTPAGHVVSNSAIMAFGEYIRSYSPAISLSGVGNAARHNLIASAPHAGIIVSGNDHIVDSNELHHLVCDTNDASAIYMGRDWTQRGNRITGNYIHDLAQGSAGSTASGVYLDDQFSGVEIAENVFARMPHGVFLGGGRDNLIHNNIFIDMVRSAIWLDDRGISWQRNDSAPGGLFRKQLDQSPYRTPRWQQRYPGLLTLLAHQPGAPVGNAADANIVVGSVLLWASPMNLSLAGTRNVIRPAPDARTNPGTSLQSVYRLTGKARSGDLPGPTDRLLYRDRLKGLIGCPG